MSLRSWRLPAAIGALIAGTLIAVLPLPGAEVERAKKPEPIEPEPMEPDSARVAPTSLAITVQIAPAAYRLWLAQNFPNPFSRRTDIAWSCATDSEVSIRVYDIQGRLVVTLVDRRLEAGPHRLTWNGTDSRGRPLPSGVYIYRFRAGAYEETKKLVLRR